MRVEMTEVYRDWIDALKDRPGRARILVRVDRLVQGNPGQHRVLSRRSKKDIRTAIALAKGLQE
jgi:putative component of toxin-antitoxin plasmid stabilization module